MFAVLFAFQFALINRLFGKEAALAYTFYLALEPYFIGINRWFHLTSFEVFFSFTAFLLVLQWYFGDKKGYKNFIFSAIMIGVGLLSKMTVLITGTLIRGTGCGKSFKG